MASLYLQLLMLFSSFLIQTHCNEDTEFDFDLSDVCLSQFHIEKYTMASSDSYRDNEFTMLIFPEAQPEYAPHFQQDLCARQSKCSLPYSCFKLHSPQTMQHKEGYLSVQSLENEFSKKFYAVINDYSNTEFDAFFDYNMGFWVKYLDKYLAQINDYSHLLTHYIAFKWYYPSPINKMFYSLLIQSPSSQKVFELMSFNKPDLSLYPNLRKEFKFKRMNELRASFLSYSIDKGEYPWNRQDNADIVPIKISYACSDIKQHIEFYTNVLEAKVLYQENDIISILDGHSVSYVFMKPVNDEIEIQYVQRPIDYTFGTFTTQLYRDLLVNTHNDRITSPICGLDRWFDNHYGYNTLKFADDSLNYNYMDRVLDRLIERGLKWRVYHTPYSDESPEGKYWMKQYGFNDLYTLYVFDLNGQSIQMFGIFREHSFPYNLPIYHKQWCSVPCPRNELEGEFDLNKVYVEDTEDVIYKIIMEQNKMYNRNIDIVEDNEGIVRVDSGDEVEQENIITSPYKGKRSIYMAVILCITMAFVSCLMITFCIYRYIVFRERNTGDASMFMYQNQYDTEIHSLLHHKRHP